VQCSPITPQELLARNRDYASCGYRVIWIFQDQRYNAFRLSGAEHALGAAPYFFTNIDEKGEGVIYMQSARIHRKRRIERGGAIPLTISQLIEKQHAGQHSAQLSTKRRNLPPIYQTLFHLLLEKVTR